MSQNRPPIPVWGWLCLGGIVAIFALMVVKDAQPNSYVIGALVTLAALILGVSIPLGPGGPWGGNGGSRP